ncbi:APC family permease [Nocardiopsis mangrovi]|uniref:APC family permease n=1 Tax=Nocardiopsis mangrovi TaxID=1179818 RepID=A0ABV9E4A1_9ACTN
MSDTRRDSGGSEDGQQLGPPGPSAAVPALDPEQLQVLRHLGREWERVSRDPEVWRRALPVDPDLGSFPERHEIRPAPVVRLVRVTGLGGTEHEAEAAEAADLPPTRLGRAAHRVRRALLGAPLRNTALVRERMRKLIALPVLSADVLSSVAYAPEAMLTVLIVAGAAGLAYTVPISAAIVFLMLAVAVSYRQTIRAYPHGGGSYIVAGENLGRLPGLVAAAGLMTDYILTVAVSVAAGVAAITSAVPALVPATVPLGLGVIAVLLAGNLRGIRQAGILFAAPTYAFIAAMFALVITGLVQALSGSSPAAPPAPHAQAAQGVGVLLVMRAFASGATAMTGMEAISNAVPAFRRVEWRNARTTLTCMAVLLITLFAGLIALIELTGTVPGGTHQTVLSQLARLSFGTGWMYVFVQAATAAILLLAANTAFNDFPRVLSLMARDNHAPRIFLRLGDRLAFSNGIILLSVVAAVIFAAFGGVTTALIPLYAVGVFLAFTLSQSGMVVHWWRLRGPHWRKSLAFNATGATLSALVLLTAAIAKFTEGAWVAVFIVGLLVLMSLRVRHHYTTVDAALRLRPHAIELPRHAICSPGTGGVEGPGEAGDGRTEEENEETPSEIHHLSVVPIETVDLASMRALAYAASLQQPVLALHLSPSEEEAERFRGYWTQWGDHLPLEVVVSPYRAIVAPLVNYVEALHLQRPDLTVTVILPEVVTRRWWHGLLHDRLAARLRRALRHLPKIVITTVPFHV